MINFAKDLLTNTGKFVSGGISSELNRKFYDAEVAELVAQMTKSPDLATCYTTLTERRLVNTQRKYPFTFFGSPLDYTLLATDHALDIVQCLEKRFVTGDERVHFLKATKG